MPEIDPLVVAEPFTLDTETEDVAETVRIAEGTEITAEEMTRIETAVREAVSAHPLADDLHAIP
ncbi:hypothetical protein [Magnetospirillum fulvum]|uniref:Uncharacterized protein n=1 Tax=Magnetospirillum fulvum TaxID=1082 RepID=A0A1H6GQ94_MAGFU|nr:hypothetical protein [Magnetospirillum fulvum]SEH25619.1 hypothetical protein SAMN04244559_00251 [Magnetospirillum fulvum]